MDRWLEPHVQQAANDFEPWVKHRRTGLNLASNEFVHPAVDRLVAAAIRSAPPARISRYPYPQELVVALADRYRLAPDQVLVTAGSDDAVRCLAAAVFRSTGRLVLPEPNYALVAQYAALNGVTVFPVGLSGADYRFTVGSIREAATRARRAGPCVVYLSNPNGPVGCCLTLDEVSLLAEDCQEHGDLLVVDEAYVPYNGFDHGTLMRRYRCVVLVRSFSKSMGTAGARIGMLAGDPALVRYLRRWHPMNPVSGMAVHLVLYLMEREEELAAARTEIVETRTWFAARVAAALPGWTPVPSAANFVNFEVPEGTDAEAVAAGLRDRHIHVRCMRTIPGLERCLRVTVADHATMRRVLAALLETAQAATLRTVG